MSETIERGITRSFTGLLTVCSGANDLSPSDKETFDHAMRSFSYLVNRGETVSGNEFVDRIKKSYGSANPQVVESMRVIASAFTAQESKSDDALIPAGQSAGIQPK